MRGVGPLWSTRLTRPSRPTRRIVAPIVAGSTAALLAWISPTVALLLAAATSLVALATVRLVPLVGLLFGLVLVQDALVARGLVLAQQADEVLILLGVAAVAVRARASRHLVRTPLDLPLLGFAAAGLLAAVVRQVPPVVAAPGMLAVVKGLLAFQLTARVRVSDGQLRRGIQALLAIVTVLAAIGVAQRLGGELVYRATGQPDYYLAFWQGGKAPSLFAHHNALGHVCVLAGALALGLAMSIDGHGGRLVLEGGDSRQMPDKPPRQRFVDGRDGGVRHRIGQFTPYPPAPFPQRGQGERGGDRTRDSSRDRQRLPDRDTRQLLDGRDKRRLLVVGGVCLLGLLASASRESWLAVACALPAVALVTGSRRLLRIALVTVAILTVGGILVYASSPALRDEVARRAAGVLAGWQSYRLGFTGWAYRGEYRVYVLLKSWTIFRDHMWLGTGPGRFGGHVASLYLSPIYDRYHFLPLDGVYQPLDIFWSRLLTEFGLLGSAFYLWSLAVATRAHLAARRSSEALVRGLGTGGLIAVPAVVVIACFSPALEDSLVAIPFWGWAGLSWALAEAIYSATPAPEQPRGSDAGGQLSPTVDHPPDPP